MIRLVLLTWRFVLTPLTLAEDQREGWPRPEYQRHSEDPEWLVQVVHFHGHPGPSVVAGGRMGMAGLRAVKAKGYFDVEVINAVKLREVVPITTLDDAVLRLAGERFCILITCNRDDFLAAATRIAHRGIIILIRRKSRLLERAALVRLLDLQANRG